MSTNGEFNGGRYLSGGNKVSIIVNGEVQVVDVTTLPLFNELKNGVRFYGPVVVDIDYPKDLPWNPERRTADSQSIDRLAKSMDKIGQMDMIWIGHVLGEHHALEGHRRRKSAKSFGEKTIKALVAVGEEEHLLQLYIEKNGLQEQHKPADLIEAVRKGAPEFDGPIADVIKIAKELGIFDMQELRVTRSLVEAVVMALDMLYPDSEENKPTRAKEAPRIAVWAVQQSQISAIWKFARKGGTTKADTLRSAIDTDMPLPGFEPRRRKGRGRKKPIEKIEPSGYTSAQLIAEYRSRGASPQQVARFHDSEYAARLDRVYASGVPLRKNAWAVIASGAVFGGKLFPGLFQKDKVWSWD